MFIEALVRSIEDSSVLDSFWGKLDQDQDATLGVAASARPLLVAARFIHKPQPTLVIIAGEEGAEAFALSLSAYIGRERVLRFYDRVDNPFTTRPSDPHQIACRMESLHALTTERECVVVCSARALLRTMPPVGSSTCLPLVFEVAKELGELANDGVEVFSDIMNNLDVRGYVNTGELEGPGTFCVKGGTIDVFPGNLPYPVRLDFFGDQLEEIRRIIPGTGQTFSHLKKVDIYPVREFSFSARGVKSAREKYAKKQLTNRVLAELLEKAAEGIWVKGSETLLPYVYASTSTLGNYLKPGVLTVLIEPRSLFDDALHAYEEMSAIAKGSGISTEGLYVPATDLNFGKNQRATYVSIMQVGSRVDDELPVKRADVAGHEEKLFAKLRSLIDEGYAVVLSVPSSRARKDIKFELVDRNLAIKEVLDVGEEEPKKLQRGVVNVVDVDITLGMIMPKLRLALLSLSDTRGSSRVARGKRVDITDVTFPYKPGDYVVHASHGIAFFREIIRQDVGGVLRDYLLLEYAEEDKLYVPVEQLDRVTRYVGPEGASPRLTRLNTSDWSRSLAKARKATQKLAFDLVDVYARRSATQGYRYSPDTPWQKEMEDAFPYDETPDQLTAIEDIKADMQSSRPMDRLICGDVGFGKTEVALRAAFKAAQDSKQVMVLCPTTILAQQHFVNFKERFEPFGVEVEVLSRFRTPAQQAIIAERFSAGEIDVLIGTHRLLSRDVSPHDLGLVIVDEEQRFGVAHKEQMKDMRESVDMLTLSATPIPRTMQMSLSGVRDMSLILTPPGDRRPVDVHIGEWDPDIVQAAIRRELARHGQIYYVSNRVRSIEEAVRRVEQAAPEARVGIAHGQMTKEELERIMEDFSAGELDVLVATTIIESGIDNPHTNTLIIEDSHRLGLAQMYQLKGRVGRSNMQAYAFFLFPGHISLTEEAAARLTAVNENKDLGSGMRIALKDLEIRGAGSLLGAEQSGNVSAVGFDLFAQMLAQAVNASREGGSEASQSLPLILSEITVNIPAHTYIPEEYIPEVDARVVLYRRIASADTIEAVEVLLEKTNEEYPGMPQATINLFEKARIKAYVHEKGLKTVSVIGGKVILDPIEISSTKQTALRRRGGRYVPKTKKLSVPLKSLKTNEEASLMDDISCLLKDLFEGESLQ